LRSDLLARPDDLAAERLRAGEVDLGEGREGLDGVREDVERDAGADGERRLLEPLAGLGAERVGAGESLPVAVKSRQARAASASTSTVAVTSRASCTASPGGSSDLDGMQAQYEHSPPTSSRSTTVTRSPPSASAPAQCSPGEPAPRTMTS
jgi:hypothetical protein